MYIFTTHSRILPTTFFSLLAFPLSLSAYTTETIGLPGTDTDEYRFSRHSSILARYPGGMLIGQSNRYDINTLRRTGQSPWIYENGITTRIGLTDAEHTGSRGEQYSGTILHNTFGQIAGISDRYTTTGERFGSNAWLYSDGQTTRIGLFDETYQGGAQVAALRGMSDAGHILGSTSKRNETGVTLGTDSWIYHNGITTKLGFTGAIYTNSNGYHESNPTAINSTGQVIGSSDRYDALGTYIGYNTWLYNNGVTTKIGLTDTVHTGSGGQQYSRAILNEAGQAAGTSSRYGDAAGDSAWLFNNGVTTRIGLTDTGIIDNSTASYLNNAGQVAGISTRREAATGYGLGTSAWIHSNGVTTEIGLTDVEHTFYEQIPSWDIYSSGQRSTIRHLNEAGQVAGYSKRFEDVPLTDITIAKENGQSAWLYSGGITTRIGLNDADHTDRLGFQNSYINRLNEAGQVLGGSTLYNNSANTENGNSMWLYSNGATTRIGLTDALHTGSDGLQKSFVISNYTSRTFHYPLNEAGQVVGHSERYDPASGASRGTTAWLFDSSLNRNFVIDLTTDPNTYSKSTIHHFGDDGLVLGHYTLYGEDHNAMDYGTFAFTKEHGAIDLFKLATGELGDTSWGGPLEHVYRATDLGNRIVGFGFSSGAYVPYFQFVPIPAPVYMFGAGVLALFAISKRKRKHAKMH